MMTEKEQKGLKLISLSLVFGTLLDNKEQKGLKLISLSLVLGTLLDKKEHLWTKREQLFC